MRHKRRQHLQNTVDVRFGRQGAKRKAQSHLDTAATDITHYLTAGSGVLVLCGGAVRCRNMQEFLQRRP